MADDGCVLSLQVICLLKVAASCHTNDNKVPIIIKQNFYLLINYIIALNQHSIDMSRGAS